MDIDLVFKIAAIGIIVSESASDPFRTRGPGHDDDTGRSGRGTYDAGAADQ